MNKLIEKLGKGQEVLNRGGEIVEGVNGVKKSIKNMDPKLFKNFFLKNNKGNVAVNPEGIKHFLGKMQNVLGTGNDIFQNLNKVTGGKNKFINKAINVIQKGQQGIEKGQQGVEKVETFLNTENPIEKAHQVWETVEQIAHSMKEATEQPVAEQPVVEEPSTEVQPTEEPSTEVPVAEEPAQPDVSPVEEPSTEVPVAEEQPSENAPALDPSTASG